MTDKAELKPCPIEKELGSSLWNELRHDLVCKSCPHRTAPADGLREALEKIANMPWAGRQYMTVIGSMARIAKAALSKNKEVGT